MSTFWVLVHYVEVSNNYASVLYKYGWVLATFEC
jgi:hypothetical protein